ncbi:MAG: hypothetical protein RL748_3959 [Pseudomonadota bacterium]|jgi:uncharacterized RDD family membrane protein YckC
MLDGNLALITPEGIRLRLTPAGPMLRAFAWLIDLLIWGGAMWFIIFLIGLVFQGSKLADGFILIILFCSYWGYPIISEVYGGGRTVGKRAVGIQVVRSDGLPVGWRESTLRNLLLVADFLPMLYVSGLICMLFDTQFRRLGDWVAGTQVVYLDKPGKRIASPNVKPIPLPFPITPQQQRALADLFEREASLPPARLAELGSIAEVLTGKTGKESIEQLRGFVAGIMQ